MRKLCLCLTFNLMALNLAVMAGVHYDAGNKILWVTGYEREYPCTPERLLLADQMHGWGVVTRDGKQTYVIGAELRIGTDDGCDTYFQVGNAAVTEPEIVMQGALVVMISRATKAVNRLTVGDPVQPDIRPVLRLAPKTSLLVGAVPDAEPGGLTISGMTIGAAYGAEAGIYHSRLTCAQSDQDFERCWLKGRVIELRDTHVSRAANGVYVVSERAPVVAGCVFEDCGIGLHHFFGGEKNARTKIAECVFRRCRTALQTPNRVVFERCSFEENQRHWITGDQFQWIAFLDCRMDESRHPNRTGGLKSAARRKGWDSLVFMQNTLPINVADKNGAAVPGAKVSFLRLADKVEDQVFVDKSGQAVIVLETRRLTVGEEPEKPLVEDHFYRVTVTAPDYKETVLERQEAKSLPSVLNIVLEK